MELDLVIESRRSIRAYQANRKVDKAQIEEIVSCLQNAPSWKNSQTGRYYVALSEEKVRAVRELLPAFNADRTQDVSAYIVTAFEKNFAGFDRDGNPTDDLGNGWGAYDLGLQNALLLLKARELGLDTLIMGLRNGDGLRKEFSIPSSQQIVAVIAIGYRNEEPEKPKRKPLDEILKIY
jgi:nitroreductase